MDTAELLSVRNQHSTIKEAEELIQSWLEGVENSRLCQSRDLLAPPTAHLWEQQTSGFGREGLSSLEGAPHAQTYASATSKQVHFPDSTTSILAQNVDILPKPSSSSHVEHHPLAVPTPLTCTHDPGDFLSSVDWDEGDVGENVHLVVQGLMRKSLAQAQRRGRGRKSHDPRVTMEMRHKEVKERRKVRDTEQTRVLRSRLSAREARREAEVIVRREEEGRRRRLAQEEQLVREQMSAIRRQMRERERERRPRALTSKSVVQQHTLLAFMAVGCDGEGEAVMRCAEECVKEGRRRTENRSELIKQLHEIEAAEAKDNLKILHKCFSSWYSMVVERRARLGKAAAVGDWKLLLRAWGAWRGYVRGRRTRREREMLAREMQREKRQVDLAVRHYSRRLQLRCLSSWLYLARRERGRREQELRAREHREKVAAFLQLAASGRLECGGEEGSEGPRSTNGRLLVQSSPQKKKTVPGMVGKDGSTRPTDGPVTKAPPDPIIWQTARQQLDKLLSEAAHSAREETASVESEGEGEGRKKNKNPGNPSEQHCDGSSGHAKQQATTTVDQQEQRHRDPGELESSGSRRELHHQQPGSLSMNHLDGSQVGGAVPKKSGVLRKPPPPPKPVTRPISMSGMEARSAEMARRREEREQRRREAERERLVRLEREEEERKKAELEAREALAAKRREERRLARQRELEKQRRLQHLAELNARATQHYERVLQLNMGLRPWRKFVELLRKYDLIADDFCKQHLVQRSFFQWRDRRAEREKERETKANVFYHMLLLKTTMQAWKEYVCWCHCLEEAVAQHRPELLLRKVLRGWDRVTGEERVATWEKERRAKMHHRRQLKQRVVIAWRGYLPLAREERAKEVRRGELRRKVAQWLPDYLPPSQTQ